MEKLIIVRVNPTIAIEKAFKEKNISAVISKLKKLDSNLDKATEKANFSIVKLANSIGGHERLFQVWMR